MPVSEMVESGSDFWSCQMAFPFVVKNFRPPLEGKWQSEKHAYNVYNSSFSELFEMANESKINIRNLFLLIEVQKCSNGLSPPITNKQFQTNDWPYDLRNRRILVSQHKSTTKYGIDTIAFIGP